MVDYLLSHLGFFAVLPVLPLLVERLDPGTSAVFVGSALLFFNFAVRGGSLFISGLLHRAPVRRTMSTGLLLTGLAFGLLATSPGRTGVVMCLIAAGLGISTNGLAARAYVAMAIPDSGMRNSVFSAVQVAANVAAAIGPVIASFLVHDRHDVLLLLLVSTMYVSAAAFVAAVIPGDLRPRDGDVREPLRIGLIAAIVTDARVRRVSTVTAVGSFLYGQFFSAFAIQAMQVGSSPTIYASFFTANAILVILLQIPVARHTTRGLDRGRSPLRYLLIGVATFAGSCAVFGSTGSMAVGLLIGVVAFSLAETFFTPLVNTAYAEIAGDRPVVEAFNLRQVAASAGESLGAFCGGALFPLALSHGHGELYWFALAAVGLTFVATHMRPGMRCSEVTTDTLHREVS